MKKRISIVIVTYNSENHIYDCLESIFNNNDIENELEVIIVDNASKNVDSLFGSIEQKYGKSVVLIKNTKNGGYGQGNNVGIKNAKGDIIMIMNPDVRLVNPIFQNVIQQFSNKKLGMLGLKQNVTQTKSGISFMSKLQTSPIIGIFETVLFNKLNIYIPSRMYFSGACFLIRKDLFIKLGLFDENVFMYGEENYLHYRLNMFAKDFKIVFNPKIKYLHLTDNRPLSIKSANQMLDASIKFYLNLGFDTNYATKLLINQEITRAKLFRIIERLKSNKNRLVFYNEWIKCLKERL